MRVVGCFLKYNDRFVLLYRNAHKPDGNTWGLPSGKVEPGENDEDAMIRELEEETGYAAHSDELKILGEYDFVSTSSIPYTYVTYELVLKNNVNIRLDYKAHSESKWVTVDEADEMSTLIHGLHELFRMVGYI